MQKNIKFKAFSLMELSIVILIVGLLIAGIFKSKNLLQDFRTQSAQKQTLSSPVNTIRDLVLWYETSSTNSFDKAETTDGATITNWYDLNPQSSASDKNDATPYYGTVLYEKDVFNGLPGVYFSTISSIAASLQYSITALTNHSFTVFVVEKKAASITSGDHYIVGGRGNATNQSFGIYYSGLSSTVTSGLRNNTVSFTSSPNSNTPIIHTLIMSSVDGTYYWSNGGLAADAYDATKTGPFDNAGTIGRLGNYFYSYTTQYSYNGHIAEYIIFARALNDTERQAVEDYLSKKYNIKLT